MFRVGNQGDRGSVEIQDILFTTKGATPGAVLVAWNLLADQQGSAGMWGTFHTTMSLYQMLMRRRYALPSRRSDGHWPDAE